MKRIILLCGCLLAGFSAKAQLTLDACRELARAHYPEIRQYDLIRRTAEYTVSNARRAYLPQFGFSAQATWQSAVTTYPAVLTDMLAQQGVEIPGLNKDQYKLQLELNQTIWDGGKARADRQVAEAEAAESRHSVDVDLYDLDGRIDGLYFGILLFDERIAQTELTMELLQSNLEKVRALQQNGVAMPADSDAVEAELLTVGQQLAQAEATRESYCRMLSIFIGRDMTGEKLVRPEVAEPLSRESDRPELALFDARIEKFAAQERQVKASTRPRFGIFAQGYYGYPGLDFMEGMLGSDWSWNAVIGVRMSWNFGGYYTRKNSLDKLKIAQRQVEVQRDIFLFNSNLQVVEENGEIARLRKALADDDRIVMLRRSVREAAESKLRNGIIDTNDLLQKITDEAAAAMARSAREIELIQAIYELKHTINR